MKQKRKNFKKSTLLIIVLFLCVTSVSLFLVSGCSQAETITYNIQVEADKFNVYRKMTFVNLYTNDVLYDVEGYFSLQTTYENEYQGQQEIAVTILTGHNQYKVHYFSVANNVTYVIEQLEPTHDNPYFWKINWYVALPNNVGG